MKTLTLITGGRSTADSLRQQMAFYFGDDFPLHILPIDDGLPEDFDKELIVFSSPSVRDDFRKMKGGLKGHEEILAGRTINMENIAKLVAIVGDAPLLFINDHMDSARECIRTLREIGFISPELIPCAPPALDTNDCRKALTAGEAHLVPAGVDLLMDLGCRILDYPSILKIANALNLDISDKEAPSTRYLRQIVKHARWRKTLNSRLLTVIEGLSEGMISYQLGGSILVINEKAKSLLLENRNLFGKRIQKVIRDTDFRHFLLTPDGPAETVLTINGRELLLNRIVHKEGGTAVCRIKSLSEMEDDSYRIRELRRKGFYAKYVFGDILGDSHAIRKARDIAAKLADTSLTILIEGASGTGKELLASAIHNSSPRRNRPYVAVNLSAVNEALLESELFGYESGAFTGASKEGKPGLFEQADGGTLFLDEIGEISPAIQKGLLRVLQEGEVMRVGGRRIRKVDVRIIAATNRDLFRRTGDGKFREDLLYRIRQGYIRLPSLKERSEDIPALISAIMAEQGNKHVGEELLEKLCRYEWPGNIRELKNLLICTAAVSDNDILLESDIPEGMFRLPDHFGGEEEDRNLAVLKASARLMARGRRAGREAISDELSGSGYPLSPAQVRSVVNELMETGLVRKIKGSYGIVLSEAGEALLGS